MCGCCCDCLFVGASRSPYQMIYQALRSHPAFESSPTLGFRLKSPAAEPAHDLPKLENVSRPEIAATTTTTTTTMMPRTMIGDGAKVQVTEQQKAAPPPRVKMEMAAKSESTVTTTKPTATIAPSSSSPQNHAAAAAMIVQQDFPARSQPVLAGKPSSPVSSFVTVHNLNNTATPNNDNSNIAKTFSAPAANQSSTITHVNSNTITNAVSTPTSANTQKQGQSESKSVVPDGVLASSTYTTSTITSPSSPPPSPLPPTSPQQQQHLAQPMTSYSHSLLVHLDDENSIPFGVRVTASDFSSLKQQLSRCLHRELDSSLLLYFNQDFGQYVQFLELDQLPQKAKLLVKKP